MPKTGKRLMKLAHSLASFIRNASKKRDRDYRRAIEDWTHDLAYLKEQFYEKWPNFDWPEYHSRD